MLRRLYACGGQIVIIVLNYKAVDKRRRHGARSNSYYDHIGMPP